MNTAGFEASQGISAADAGTMLDLNADGHVNNADLQWLLNYLKSGAGGTVTVAEPTTFVLGIIWPVRRWSLSAGKLSSVAASRAKRALLR